MPLLLLARQVETSRPSGRDQTPMEADLAAPKLLNTRTSPLLFILAVAERALRSLGSLLPDSVKRRLLPETDPEEAAGEESCSDLLSVSQRRIKTADGRRDVVLSIETFSALQSKVSWGADRHILSNLVHVWVLTGLLQVVHTVAGVTGVTGYAVLVTLVVLKWKLSGKTLQAGSFASMSTTVSQLARVCRQLILLQQLVQRNLHHSCRHSLDCSACSRQHIRSQNTCQCPAGQPLVRSPRTFFSLSFRSSTAFHNSLTEPTHTANLTLWHCCGRVSCIALTWGLLPCLITTSDLAVSEVDQA